jgi:hypothetical protein
MTCFNESMIERLNEANRDFTDWLEKPDLSLASVICLGHSQRQAKVVNREAIQELEAKFTIAKSTASDLSLVLAAMVLLYLDRPEESLPIISKALKNAVSASGTAPPAISIDLASWCHALNGWTFLPLGSKYSQAEELFGLAASTYSIRNNGSRFFEAVMGRMALLQCTSKYDQALQESHQAVIYFPNFTPALIEQMNLFLLNAQWDQAVRIANKILSKTAASANPDPKGARRNLIGSATIAAVLEQDSIDAKKILALHELVCIGNRTKSLDLISKAFSALSVKEPRSYIFCLDLVKAFSRCCGRNES